MKIGRKMKQAGKKVDRKFSGGKRKVKRRRSVAAKARHVAKPLRRKTAGTKRTTQSKAREAGKAMGTLIGKAIGNTERLINKTAETAKDFLR